MLTTQAGRVRRRYQLRGQVQGVGFRPFVYRVAVQVGVGGFVANDSNGAVIEVEGTCEQLAAVEASLRDSLPPLARVTEMSTTAVPPAGDSVFRIRASQSQADRRPEVTPDAATCGDCRRELLDVADRRYRYPFTNCTNCGPRYSIIRTVPYDRPSTTMAAFTMCADCAREYADPGDRRFHAQPNACPVCGPRVALRLVRGNHADLSGDAIAAAGGLLREGGIIAVKGLGGYHLSCRADRQEVVERLRRLKLRDGKPLAVMVPDLAAAHRVCRLSAADTDALQSPAAPIVLAPKAAQHGLAESVAAGCGDFGIMLPYTPLHHLLLGEALGPLVMTSANLAGLPLTYRDEDAEQLSDVAEAFLTHDREIFRPIDDSVVFTFRDEVIPIRRARGYAPRPLMVRWPRQAGGGAADGAGGGPAPRILAVGGELKSVVCLLRGEEAVISEHLGDLTRPETYRHFVEAIERLEELCGFEPDIVACDLHPRYLATEYAGRLGRPVVHVQHHHAHIASVMAEWGEPGPVVGLSCDGTGFGPDGAVWGCELLLCACSEYRRLGHLDYFPLVGGDLAAVQTWRPAAALVRQAYGANWLAAWNSRASGGGTEEPDAAGLRMFESQAAAGVNSPPTSSLGRVFDAAAFLLGLCGSNRHEAEGAMAVEAAAGGYPLGIEPLEYEVGQGGDGIQMAVAPMIRGLVDQRRRGTPVGELAARFHETLARMLVRAVGLAGSSAAGLPVALSGGCFANRRLLARVVELLEGEGRRVLYNRAVPAGDGGIALGQAVVAAYGVGSREP